VEKFPIKVYQSREDMVQ